MKKRLFALATAVVMTLSMGMPAMAASSPTVTNPLVKTFANSATAVINGETVNLDFDWGLRKENLTQQQGESLDYYYPTEVTRTDEEWQKLMQKRYERARELFEKVMGYRDESVVINDWFGLSLPTGYTIPAEGVDVTINAPYAGEGEYTYYIFHCKADGTWEYIPTTEGEGTLSGRFTSFSPIFIMRVPKTETPGNTGNTGTPAGTPTGTPAETPATGDIENVKSENLQNTNTVSTQNVTTATSKTTAPKTGDYTGIYVAGMMAVLSTAGIVVYMKKEKAIK